MLDWRIENRGLCCKAGDTRDLILPSASPPSLFYSKMSKSSNLEDPGF